MKKWYMHNLESVLENKMHSDFEIQTDHLISARQPNRVIVNKKKKKKKKKRIYLIVNLTVLADHRVKLKEGEKSNEYLDIVRELKKKKNGT